MLSPAAPFQRLHVIDSHTAGEPTRVVVEGGPDLGGGELQERLRSLRENHDNFRTKVISEPRGSEVIVGALLCTPVDPHHAAGVIFFNDVGYLGMCGHGTIGVVTTLAHLGRIGPGEHVIETPVGIVRTELHADGSVSVKNISSYRYRKDIPVDVPGYGRFVGDIAWSGNWFFLIGQHTYDLVLSNRAELIEVTTAIRSALVESGITGSDGALIDHIELFSAPEDPSNSSRNFVLCPGASFDRSPCGTGTSAKMACLHADGKLQPEQSWRQEGILGTVFVGSVEAGLNGNGSQHLKSVTPTIKGRAWITAESTLLFDPSDPFQEGIAF
ncbi:MAG: proline racemase family protein [Acidobacteriaceae bacterium]